MDKTEQHVLTIKRIAEGSYDDGYTILYDHTLWWLVQGTRHTASIEQAMHLPSGVVPKVGDRLVLRRNKSNI